MKKIRRYPYELKRQAVELYFEGESAPTVQEKFKINNVRRVFEWVEIVRKFGYSALEYGVPKTAREDLEKNELREENTRLKLENELLKKLVDLKRG